MKQLSLSLLLTFASVWASAQNQPHQGVPEAVKAAFSKQHPKASNQRWEKERSCYEVSYKEYGRKGEMKFDATGKVLESESEIDFGGLPEAAQIYLKGAHAGQSPHEVTQETNAKGQTAYEVSYPDIEYLFDGAGLLLKKHEREKHDDQTDHENDNDDDDED